MGAYKYHAHYPDGYADDPGQYWPVLITLHGAGERHVSLDVLKTHHYYRPMYELTSRQYPCIVVVPHCPPRQHWEPRKVRELLDLLLDLERIDPTRVYLNGFSMGGYGTWLTAEAYPDLIAAIAPVCGGGDPDAAHRLRDTPIWAFHGAKDDVVPVEETLRMVEAVKAAGGNPKLTIYPEGDHGVWDDSFANPELYAWMLAQQQ